MSRTTLFLTISVCTLSCVQQDHSNLPTYDKSEPYDHAYQKRYAPEDVIDHYAAVRSIETAKASSHVAARASAGWWITEGPANIGARVNTVAASAINPNILVAGFSSGGLYMSKSGGGGWFPVFDDKDFLAIGDIAFSPHDPTEILVGTGDPNISGFPFLGNGIYKSDDCGQRWQHLGLRDIGIISKIAFHPTEPLRYFAASMGIPHKADDRRGLYQTLNGGKSWQKILSVGSETGVIDFLQHPNEPDILFAAGWDRVRTYEQSVINGNGGRIHRSIDGGENWELLTNDLPLEPIGRIGLAMAPSNPDRIYAVYVGTNNQLHSIHTSTDRGSSWREIPTDSDSRLSPSAFGGFGWYFGKIRVHPLDERKIYLLGVRVHSYDPNVRRWRQITSTPVHADAHDLIWCGPDTMIVATDGGLYRSLDRGESWSDIEDIPTTQFYRIDYNPHQTDFTYGGAQDNGISRGNEDNLASWERISGADGFRTIFHPDNPDLYYVESQRGGLSVTQDDGFTFQSATAGISDEDRSNWDLPVIMSHFDPDVLYYATNRLYRSTTGADVSFEPISKNLTDSIVAYAPTSSSTALAESPLDKEILVVGTGDGHLWRTSDGGQRWIEIGAQLPKRWYTSISLSAQSKTRIFVTQTGYKNGDFTPYIHRSDDLGDSWVPVHGDLPGTSVNHLHVLANNGDQVLFAGTDIGPFLSTNEGESWTRLGDNFPYIPIYEQIYNPEKNHLVAGTFGKSILSFDLDQVDLDGKQTIATSERHEQIEMYPNPAIDFVFLKDLALSQESQITAINLAGHAFALSLNTDRINVTSLPAGLYILQIRDARKRFMARFIKL